MGTWTIQIKGCGPHDNKDFEGDADKLAKDFVALIKAHGHRLDSAYFNLTDGYDCVISSKTIMPEKPNETKGKTT